MTDLLVVGAGPAGLATALHAARCGLSVTVMEQRSGPLDKACGEGLMPGAVRALDELGVAIGGRPFRGIRYLDERRQVEAHFRHGTGRGVRRTELQSAMHERALEAGVEIVVERAGRVRQDATSVTVAGRTARYLVAADGLHSPIREQLGLSAPDRRPRRFGLRRHYAVRPWTDLVEVHWSRGAEAYVTPIADDLVGVAVLTQDRGPYEQHLTAFPRLIERLARAGETDRAAGTGAALVHAPTPATSVRGAGPLRQRVRSRVAGRVLLVGDAAGYVDALTGEGIAVSLACAPALVQCLVSGRPEAYEREWAAASRRYRVLTESLLWARRQPPLAASIVPAAALLPRLFAGAVGQLAR